MIPVLLQSQSQNFLVANPDTDTPLVTTRGAVVEVVCQLVRYHHHLRWIILFLDESRKETTFGCKE
jgi:hypothetical protein